MQTALQIKLDNHFFCGLLRRDPSLSRDVDWVGWACRISRDRELAGRLNVCAIGCLVGWLVGGLVGWYVPVGGGSRYGPRNWLGFLLNWYDGVDDDIFFGGHD